VDLLGQHEDLFDRGDLALVNGRSARLFVRVAEPRADPHGVQDRDGYSAEAERVLSTMPAT